MTVEDHLHMRARNTQQTETQKLKPVMPYELTERAFDSVLFASLSNLRRQPFSH